MYVLSWQLARLFLVQFNCHIRLNPILTVVRLAPKIRLSNFSSTNCTQIVIMLISNNLSRRRRHRSIIFCSSEATETDIPIKSTCPIVAYRFNRDWRESAILRVSPSLARYDLLERSNGPQRILCPQTMSFHNSWVLNYIDYDVAPVCDLIHNREE